MVPKLNFLVSGVFFSRISFLILAWVLNVEVLKQIKTNYLPLKLFIMKTGIIAPLTLSMLFILTSSCVTQVHTQPVPTKTVTVEAMSDDISYNLDLRAVATVFANSRNLEDFEYRLNDYESGISNLDLNRDGQVDYLRVVEMYENRTRLVVVQAVLGYNVFQDVATIVVESKNRNTAYVQIVGDPYIYGVNYIIEPVFYATPVIYTSFWAPHYVVWRSPYYWGYYPRYYYHKAPVRTNVYINNIHIHVNNRNNYNYTTKVRNQRTVSRMSTTVSRSDYAKRNPGQSFTSRNTNVRNTREMQARDSRATQSRTNQSGTRSNSSTATPSRSSSSSTTTGPRSNSSTNSRQNTSGTSTNSRQNSSGTSTTNSRQNTQGTGTNSSGTSRQTTTQPSSTTNTRQNSNSSGTSTRSSSSSSSGSKQTTTQPRNSSSSSRSNSSGTVNSNSSSSRSNSSPTSTRSSGSSSSSNRSSGTSVRQSTGSSSSSPSRSSGTSSSGSSRSSGSSSSSSRSSGSTSRSSR
ncbi:hypothetical protein D0T49_11585 [Paludibacter sp. 221]|nr:hypothetical protein [Paludibacter sp. 221]